MIGSVIAFFVGLFLGGFFGCSTMALMVAARDADDKMQDFSEKKNKGHRDESNDQSPTK